ncbi:MAG: amidinotransferase, partial [Candidatus Aminicenantes bacterium]|nr:amidinotransferase [Candidatus Aminicenantes bacterium]
MAVKRDIRPAAFGGRGWRPRRGTLADDIREGRVWASCGLNSEYGRLREVVLYRPPARTPPPADPNAVQHLERVDWARVAGEIGRAAACFRRLGVDVLALRPRLGRTAFKPEDCPNLVFVRDLFFMTPQGAIVSRMASAVRAGEERHLARALAERGVPILGTIAGSGTFEGADALWLRPGLVAVGLGNRTNAAGFGQLSDILRRLGAACLPVSLPPGVQHLLGCLQVVDGDLAAVRPRLLPQAARRRLAEEGFETVPLPED